MVGQFSPGCQGPTKVTEGVDGHPKGHGVGRGCSLLEGVCVKEISEVKPWKSKASSPAGGYANGAETAEVGGRLALPGQAHGLEAPAPQPKGNDLVLASGAGHTLTRVLMLTRTPATLQESLETRLFPYVSSCRRREEGGKKRKRKPD